jgi:GNAT superfamily N-acetyltransferase
MRLSLDHEVSPAEADYLEGSLRRFGEEHAGPRNRQSFAIALRGTDGRVCGGILGDTVWNWLQIGTLWLEDGLRGKGRGHALLDAAEILGVERGCRYARLSTFEFEARVFCEAHGYSVYGQCDAMPRGHTQFHLSKKL